MTFKYNRYGELIQSETVYTYVIDLNERGYFNAHVENSKSRVVFSFSNDDSEDGSLSLVEDGYMKHIEDVSGLKSYLVDMGIMKENYRLAFRG